MKNLIVFLFAFLLSFSLIGQTGTCDPDPAITDTTGVFPMPYHAELNPEGGITESACINKPYEFIFTVSVGDSIDILGPKKLDSIIVNDVENLPVGMSYACNPPNCTFYSDSTGCAVIYGTATDENEPGDFFLTIKGTAYFQTAIGPVSWNISFPDENFAPGDYILTLEDENSSNCYVADIDEEAFYDEIKITPNPAKDFMQLQISSKYFGKVKLNILSLFGQKVLTQDIIVTKGDNSFDINLKDIPDGFYIFSLDNGESAASGKFIINR